MARSIPWPNPSQRRRAPGSTTMGNIGGCSPHRSSWLWAGALCAAAIAIGTAWIAAERIGVERLHGAGTHKLDLYAASLESALGKYEYLPGVVALRTDVVALLRNPVDLDLQQ